MNHNRSFIRKHKMSLLLLGAGLIILLILLVVWIVQTAHTEEAVSATEEEELWEDIPDEPVSEQPVEKEELPADEPEEEEEAEEVAPAPGYDFNIEEVTVKIPDLERPYNFVWVSDLHMITDTKPGDVSEEYLDKIAERYDDLPITDDGVHADELWPEIVKFINYGEYDGVLMGGDMMDYCSHSNVEVFLEGYEQIKCPILYIRSDHDQGAWYGGDRFTEEDAARLHQYIDGNRIEDQIWEFDQFKIVGINNSHKNMGSDQLEVIKAEYKKDKPVIAMTHVPYMSYVDESLEKKSYEVRNKPYYWGSGNYKPNDKTIRYLTDVYKEDTLVVEVIAGHLHDTWDGMMTEQVHEHIFGPAFKGNLGVIHVVKQ